MEKSSQSDEACKSIVEELKEKLATSDSPSEASPEEETKDGD
jgi:hypothetical protein